MIGETIGNFKIVERIGRGGMGEVYLAEQTSIGTRSAIKILNPSVSSDEEHVKRFFNEARAVSTIQHSGIVKIFDVGYAPGGEAYLIMEYLEGETLAKRIADRGPLPLPMLADIGKQIASVLGATHGAGITHRDLKPDNIYIIPDRELASGERVKILDFGIAKLTGALAADSPQTIGTMGTPAYMAPEQWGDTSKVDWRADVYSLGCVAFEMATGRPPFIVTTIAEACAMHLHEVPVRASTIAPVPAALDELLVRLLEKTPEARPQSMQEIARAFDAIGEGRGSEIRAAAAAETRGSIQAPVMAATLGGSAANVGTIPPAVAPKKSRAALFAVIGVAIAGAGGAATYLAVSHSSSDKPEPPKVAHHTPPPPPVADAALAPPPPTPDAAAVVVETAVDAGIKHAPPPHHVIDPRAIDDVLHTKQAEFDHCFIGARNSNPDVQATVKLEFAIEPDGLPVQTQATFDNGSHNGCMKDVLDGLKFPNPTGTRTKVERPLALHEPPPRPFRKGELKIEVEKRIGQLASCGDKAKVHGRFVAELDVAEDGSVSAVHVLGRPSESFETCVTDVLKKVRTGKPAKSFTARMPIDLP